MASGSSGQASHSGSKAFDFGSDDILCSYEDYGNQDGNNGIHTETKEFNKSRAARSPVFPAATYSTPEESSFDGGVISTVEKTLKKYNDNLMRSLEGISSRMSQLELFCYNLDKSIGEMRLELSRDHGESESTLKSLERHIQEVHRSVQILRDKQELADTQKELAKLQLEAHKESSSGGNEKKGENPTDQQQQQQQLVLALPHQVGPQQPPIEHPQSPLPFAPPPKSMAYYLPQVTTNNNNNNNITAPPSQAPQVQQQQQQQDVSRMAPPPYQQQRPTQQPQIITSSQMGMYSTYLPPHHQSNQSLPLEMQKASFMGASEAIPYGYGDVVGKPSPSQPQYLKTTSYGPQSGGDGYAPIGLRPPGNNNYNNVYMVYDGEGGRSQHHMPSQVQQQNAYPPNPQRNNANMVVPQSYSSMRSHPYAELTDKLMGMGYRGDHIGAIIQRLDEGGQPVDFNSVLDILNGVGPASSQRGWRA